MPSSWSALHAQLVRSVDRLSARQSFETLAGRHADLTVCRDPAHLLGFLHTHDGDPARKNAILRALLGEAVAGGFADLAVEVLVLALWPGLDAIRGRLTRFVGGDTSWLDAELLGGVAVAIRSADPTKVRKVAATLLRNVERDLRRTMMSEVDMAAVTTDADLTEIVVAPDVDDIARLARDVTCALGDDGALVVAVVLEGLTQKEAADLLGLTHDAARKRCQRTLKRLRMSQSTGADGFSPVMAPGRRPTRT